MQETAKKQYASPEQIAYAGLLDIGWKIGFGMMVATYAMYVFGIMEPFVALNDLPKYWVLSAPDYLKTSGAHAGWAWVHQVHKGDYLNFIPIAFLSGITVVCFLRVMPMFFKAKEMVYGIITVLEVIVLCLAASGILGGGAH